ncbi:MAG TPA: endoribonuclease L-PSP [Candidatus Hydrogenedentes bacterium]|nr:endoribonuclease L-PSP [Candidatus Hydrogenedentota bacterium]
MEALLVHHQAAPGIRSVSIERPGCTELLVTATPLPHEPLGAALQRACGAVRDAGAEVVSQELFGIPRDPLGKLSRATWPVTWIDGGGRRPECGGGTQLWAVAGVEVSRLMQGSRCVGSVFEDADAVYCRLGGLRPADVDVPKAAQAESVFGQMGAFLESVGLAWGHVVRTWFYNCDMLEWYGDFNEVRSVLFRKYGVFDGLVPASTGIGGANAANAALVGHLLAVQPKHHGVSIQAVRSPLQGPALEYGSGFNRAVEVAGGGVRRLYVSGTASIDQDGQTLHVGDMGGQVARTMEVVEAILVSRGMKWADVARAIAYCKHGEDAPVFEAYCAARGLAALPVVVTCNDICREALLFEIELDAIGCEGRRFDGQRRMA